jgi:hypothetical protein
MVAGTSGNPRLRQWLAGGVSLLALTMVPSAQASGPEALLNAAALIQMETEADHAKPRDQCYLYTQLVDALTVTAARQVAAGEDEDAGKTVGRIGEVSAKLQRAAARDAKKLKDAEKMLSESARKLQGLSRIASGGERDQMRATLAKLDAAHNKVLDLVFRQ